MKKVNLVFGRFQPMTTGHIKCVDKAWKEEHIPSVICMIDTPDNKVDERHPFPSSLLLPLYNDLFKKDSRVEKVITVRNANPVIVHKELGDRYQIVSVTCGTDRFEKFQWMYKYKEQANLSDDFKIIEIKRSEEDESATKARKALLDDDKTTFDKLMPVIPLEFHLKNDIYSILREQILKVYK